jgi:hypothetical protein
MQVARMPFAVHFIQLWAGSMFIPRTQFLRFSILGTIGAVQLPEIYSVVSEIPGRLSTRIALALMHG